MMHYALLKVEVHTKDKRDRTRVHLVVITVVDLRIQSVVVCDGEHIRNGAIDTSCQSVPVAALEQVGERVAECDVVALQERGVVFLRTTCIYNSNQVTSPKVHLFFVFYGPWLAQV